MLVCTFIMKGEQMAFNKKTWVDRNVEHPARRKLTAVSGEADTYDVVRAEGTITDVGDAFNAETMNDLENRIADSVDSIISKLTILTITLGTSWTQDSTNGYYYQSVSNGIITSSDNPVLDVVLSGTSANMQSLQKEWAKVLSATTYNNGIKFYAKEATTTSLTVLVKR